LLVICVLFIAFIEMCTASPPSVQPVASLPQAAVAGTAAVTSPIT